MSRRKEKDIEITDFKSLLKKQGYSLAGKHSAVKTCLWLRRSIKDEGECYKSVFYGIHSHRCLQMTPTLMCNQKCLHCWRPTEVDVPMPVEWNSPVEIVGSSIESQRKLISGFGDSAPLERWNEGKNPRHVAISLSGEPTLFPHLPELIDEFKTQGFTTFVVSNGTVPDMMSKINPAQLYMSLDAPDRETYEKVCVPKSSSLWDNILKSLEVLKTKETRTVIRITLIKGVNMFNSEGFAELIRIAEPDYIEVKAYMHLGFSRKRLPREAMPSHEEVMEFSEELAEHLGYKVAGDVEVSRVVLLSKDGLVSHLM
ncbi:4-demethylwyosine synthase TYW1 [Methanolobus mangrovi]|uniref:S-adenosyl-L-methionine-dependent tRNA 4-demethylwyosine synthase n=1 Tax=Methanolobus mangrovi TaxID=3072977 RepID=A0AA51UEE2_9EURY|nr:4-demethylwyosine synthase TYW1 [Methanolobus mangrovi]WMW21621.1 4-demethylwyosine synthase TYW1 [Methanolobus mangrovi]